MFRLEHLDRQDEVQDGRASSVPETASDVRPLMRGCRRRMTMLCAGGAWSDRHPQERSRTWTTC